MRSPSIIFRWPTPNWRFAASSCAWPLAGMLCQQILSKDDLAAACRISFSSTFHWPMNGLCLTIHLPIWLCQSPRNLPTNSPSRRPPHGTNCKNSAKPSDAYAQSTAKGFGPVGTASAQTGRRFWHGRARHQAQEFQQIKQSTVKFPFLGLLASRMEFFALFSIAACARPVCARAIFYYQSAP